MPKEEEEEKEAAEEEESKEEEEEAAAEEEMDLVSISSVGTDRQTNGQSFSWR